jgi:hypothetical protein
MERKLPLEQRSDEILWDSSYLNRAFGRLCVERDREIMSPRWVKQLECEVKFS